MVVRFYVKFLKKIFWRNVLKIIIFELHVFLFLFIKMNPFGRAVETRPQLELDATSNIPKPKFVPYPSLTQPITSSLNTSTNSNLPSSSGQNNEEVKLLKSLPTTMAPPVGGNIKHVYKAKRVFKVIFY